MLQNLFRTIWHLPMVWSFIIPLAVIGLFCIVLLLEGEYGGGKRKKLRGPGHH